LLDLLAKWLRPSLGILQKKQKTKNNLLAKWLRPSLGILQKKKKINKLNLKKKKKKKEKKANLVNNPGVAAQRWKMLWIHECSFENALARNRV
jgi:hypothetical protein